MKIKKIRLINFKKFTEEKIFEFGDSNLISGKNGEGKTTVKDAIMFCFYNRTEDGSITEASKHISNGKVKTLVEIEFEKDGQTHIVRRERTVQQNRITYIDGSQSDEDSQITQETLNTLVPNYKDFLAVFNIGWFLKQSEAEKREYILNMTPPVDRKKIFKSMGGFGDYDLSDIPKAREVAMKRKADLDDKIRRIIFEEPLKIPEVKGKDHSKEISELFEKRSLKALYEMEKKRYDETIEYNKTVDKKNKAILDKANSLEVKELEKPSVEKLYELKAKVKEYEKVYNLPEGNCPTCFQTIDDTYRDKIANLNAENERKLSEAKVELTKETERLEIEMLAYEQNENRKRERDILLASFIEKLPEPEPPVNNSIIDEERLKSLVERQNKLDDMRKLIQIRRSENERIMAENAKKTEIVEEYKKKRKVVETMINIFSIKGLPAEEMKIKLEPIKEQFREFIPTIDIETIEFYKNGFDYKEVFTIFVDGKSYNKLSLGEKTRVDIAISRIINSMLKEPIDLFFLDNSEVLDCSMTLPVQNFICKVTTNQLKIN